MSRDEARKLYADGVREMVRNSKVVPHQAIVVYNILLGSQEHIEEEDISVALFALSSALERNLTLTP